MTADRKILYLHGFRSSPRSFKAQLVGARMGAMGLADQFACPQLPASPNAAIAQALQLVEGVPAAQLAIVGSSLGGYYATYLAERLGCRAVLLNPATAPLKDLSSHVGVTTQYHSDEPFEFKAAYIDQLRALATEQVTRPERYFLIAASGDEVLDYRDMVRHYAGCKQRVIAGSDHGIVEFGQYVDEVLDFCLAPGLLS